MKNLRAAFLRTAATWLVVLLLTVAGLWLLLASPPSSPAVSPSPEALTVQGPPTPLPDPAVRRAPSSAAPRNLQAAPGKVSATAAPTEDDPAAWTSEPWSTEGPEGASTGLVDQDWIPSDHSSARSSKEAPAEVGDGPSLTVPPTEARRQLGQVFPRHLPADAPGTEEAVQAAQNALEEDLGSTPMGEDLQHVAALVLTPDDASSAQLDGLDELLAVDVVVQVQVQTRMGTEELRIYRVALTRSPSSQAWGAHDISIV